MSAWLKLDAAHSHIQVGTTNRRISTSTLSNMDPSQVFMLLNLIIQILGKGLSERNIEKALREYME